MIDMLAPIVSLVGIGLQYQAQQDQLMQQYAQLNWQKERALQGDRFAQAGRQDAYGNETYYDAGLNRWMTKLTPMQKQIQQGQEREQYLNLTKDAPAARKIREAVQKRSEEAKEPYNKAMLGYQYDQPPSEGAIKGDLVKLMGTNLMSRSKADQALLMRGAARLGTGAKAEEIINATDQNLGKQQQDTLLRARNQAVQEAAARRTAHEQQWGPQVKLWADLMQQGGNLPDLPKFGIGSDLGSAMSNQSQAMSSAFRAGTEGVSSAMGGVASALGKSPDFDKLAQILAKMKSGKDTSEDQSGLNYAGESSYSQNVPGYGYNEDPFG